MQTSDRALRTVRLVALSVTLLSAGATAKGQTGPAAGQAGAASAFHEEVIAEITPGSELKSSLVGASHIAWVEKSDGKQSVKLDGKQQGGVFEDVKYLDFSSHDAHLAFFGKRDSAWIFVLDGQEHAQRYKKVTSISFQPKGSSYSVQRARGHPL